MTFVRAVYENGVFRPTEPVALSDGQEVRLTVAPTMTIAEWEARVDAASSVREWVELANSCPEPDPATTSWR